MRKYNNTQENLSTFSTYIIATGMVLSPVVLAIGIDLNDLSNLKKEQLNAIGIVRPSLIEKITSSLLSNIQSLTSSTTVDLEFKCVDVLPNNFEINDGLVSLDLSSKITYNMTD